MKKILSQLDQMVPEMGAGAVTGKMLMNALAPCADK